jgi:alkylated DNA repair dioxygenase AlkB
MVQTPLFEDLPDGFTYRSELLTLQEEAGLLDRLSRVAFKDFEMRGRIARRRVAFFGRSYDKTASPPPPLPDFLLDVRARVAEWSGIAADSFVMALVNEYSPGAPIGWHRDAPQYAEVAGVSLGSVCRMRFRPYAAPDRRTGDHPPRRRATHERILEPRSLYLMQGAARWQYEHSIPPVQGLRYSLTFRTLRPSRG